MGEQRLWTWHVAAGLLILVLGGLHMTIMHLDSLVGAYNPAGGHPVDWANVVARARSVGFLISYVLLLAAGLFHGLYGLRNIVFELGPGAALKRAIDGVLGLVGAALFVVGVWAAWASHALARAL